MNLDGKALSYRDHVVDVTARHLSEEEPRVPRASVPPCLIGPKIDRALQPNRIHGDDARVVDSTCDDTFGWRFRHY